MYNWEDYSERYDGKIGPPYFDEEWDISGYDGESDLIKGSCGNIWSKNVLKSNAMNYIIRQTDYCDDLKEKAIRTIFEEKKNKLLPFYKIRKEFYNKGKLFLTGIITKEDIEIGNISSCYKINQKNQKKCENTSCKLNKGEEIQLRLSIKRGQKCGLCGSKIITNWIKLKKINELYKSNNKLDLLDYLEKNKYIDKWGYEKIRFDGYHLEEYINNEGIKKYKIIIIEAKIKESSDIKINDIYGTLQYPLVIIKNKNILNIDVNQVEFIYFGDLEEDIKDQLENIKQNLNINIITLSFFKWCKKHTINGLYVKSIYINWNSKYKKYEFKHDGAYEPVNNFDIICESFNPNNISYTKRETKWKQKRPKKDEKSARVNDLLDNKNIWDCFGMFKKEDVVREIS